jgi:putative transcriptional regulator
MGQPMAEVEQSRLAPGLLIAMPQLRDPNFERSVVLMLEHDEKGSFGVVINNPIEATVTLQSEDGEEIPVVDNVFLGGPVAPHVCMVIHGSGWSNERTQTVSEGLFVTEPSVAVPHLLSLGDIPFRFVMGYAGWGPGQLSGELAAGAWLCAPVTADLVLHLDPEHQWTTVIRRLGVDPMMLIPAAGPQ